MSRTIPDLCGHLQDDRSFAREAVGHCPAAINVAVRLTERARRPAGQHVDKEEQLA
jgi:hypothetical protein